MNKIELNPLRKNKINLEDYDYKKDIKNRLLMAEFSPFDLEVLEEILYSPLKIPTIKLSKNLDTSIEKVLISLEKLKESGLFIIEDAVLIVDKEARKYFEYEFLKFDDDFKPDMEFLLGLLKKVPIHILPTWYSIPRISNNIFESIIEKYLQTPQIYQRYYMELNYDDEVFMRVMEEVFNAPNFRIFASDIQDKFNLTKEIFEEYMIHLEYNFICTLSYTLVDNQWIQIITPFQEWKDYLTWIRDRSPEPISQTSKIHRKRPSNFSFVEDLTKILEFIQKKPLNLGDKDKVYSHIASLLAPIDVNKVPAYFDELLGKLSLLKLTLNRDNTLLKGPNIDDWMEMSTENRALYLYRHPANRLLTKGFDKKIANERNIKETEKSIQLVIDHGWVLFDNFIKGVIIPLSEEKRVTLRKKGKFWKYQLPEYDKKDIKFIKAVIFEGLFQAGMVATGKFDGNDCFMVTPFGQTFFS